MLYPFYTYEIVVANIGYLLIFFPGVEVQYEQLNNQNDVYKHVVFKMHHCFDDQWTFDGSRGPKSKFIKYDDIASAFDKLLTSQLEMSSAVISKIHKMDNTDLRNQLFFTLNSIILDFFYVITSQIPYMTKTFLFQMLDKTSNILRLVKYPDETETRIWLKFFNKEFIENEIRDYLKEKYSPEQEKLFGWIPDMVIDEMKFSDFSEDLLRDIRNSGHGFLFNEKRYETMSGNDLEINNDITYFSISIFFYLMNQIAYEADLS